MTTRKTIDAHAGGEPLRLIVDGFPAPRGKSMLDKRDWATEHADHIRRALMLEPRGHVDMCGALLTEPVKPGSHAGLLFMHNGGYGALSGHAVIAVTTIAARARTADAWRARGDLRHAGGDGQSESRWGPVAQVGLSASSMRTVPSFVLHPGLAVTVGGRHLARRCTVRRRVLRHR